MAYPLVGGHFPFHCLLVACIRLATALRDSKHMTTRCLVYDLTVISEEKLSSKDRVDWQVLHKAKLVIRASCIDGAA